MFCEVWILKIKRCSTRKMLSGEMFCGICISVYIQLFNYAVSGSRRWDVGMWTGSGWPRIGTGGVHL